MMIGSPGWIGPLPRSCTSAPRGPAPTSGGSPSQPCSRSVCTIVSRTRSQVSGSPPATRPLGGRRRGSRAARGRPRRRPRWRAGRTVIEASWSASLTRRRSSNSSAIGIHRDLALAQVVGQPDREAGRNRHLRRPPPSPAPAGPAPSRRPVRPSLAISRRVPNSSSCPDLGGGRVAADHLGLEHVGHHDPAAVHLEVGEGIADRDAGCDEHVGVAHGIGVNEQGVVMAGNATMGRRSVPACQQQRRPAHRQHRRAGAGRRRGPPVRRRQAAAPDRRPADARARAGRAGTFRHREPAAGAGCPGHRDRRLGAPARGRRVVCERWRDGQAASLQAGLQALPEQVSEALVVLGDGPGLSPDAVRRVAEGSGLRAADYGSGRSHPVVLPRRWWPLLPDAGDTPGRRLPAR